MVIKLTINRVLNNKDWIRKRSVIRKSINDDKFFYDLFKDNPIHSPYLKSQLKFHIIYETLISAHLNNDYNKVKSMYEKLKKITIDLVLNCKKLQDKDLYENIKLKLKFCHENCRTLI